MTTQPEYQVFKICRSDGVDTGPGYWPTPMETAAAKAKKATKDAPEKATRGKAQMVRLGENSDKFIEWRVKLGILLKQELSATPNEGLPWFVQFPRGYWLYEKSNRTYVVSGYPHKAKLFKSPQEFGVHLLWLLSNSEDRADCCCIHCNVPVPGPARPGPAPDEDPVVKPSASRTSQAESSTPHAVAAPVSTPLTTTTTTSSSISSSVMKTPSTANAAASTPSSSATTHTLAPSALPATSSNTYAGQATATATPTPIQQASPSPAPTPTGQQRPAASTLLFRVGELIWFQTGSAWKLGLILFSKAMVPSIPGTHQILPIGIGMATQQAVVKEDKDVRPFQAFSVPAVSRPDLSGHSFDNTNWDAVVRSWQEKMHASVTATDKANAKSHFDATVLDASKMAALKIHHSFSLFTRMISKDGWTFYYGCFLGAERIELNDVLRVKPPPQHEGVKNLYFCLKLIRTPDANPGVVQFQGHLIELVEGSDPREAIPHQSTTWALREELAWRNSLDPSTPRKLVLLQALFFKETDIKGRFYPTHRLGPILTPGPFNNAKAAKNPSGVYLPLNDRLSTQQPPTSPYIGRKKNRLETAGKSIPHGTRFTFEPQVKEEVSDDSATPGTS